MGIAEGSCTLHVPRKAAFEKKNQPGSKVSYIKYGVFTIGGHDWEIQVYPDGAGTVTLHLCLLSSTPAEVVHCEIWTNPDYSALEFDYANNVHKPSVPQEIDSFTVAPPPKTEDSVTIKVDLSVVEVAAPAKPSNQWDPNSADISFDNNTNKPISKPDSTGPGSSQWNPSNADVSFDGSAKPNKPSAGPGSAWNPSNADVSFDNSTNKPISKPDLAKPGSNQWNPNNADVSFDGSAKPNKPSAGSGSAWNPSNAEVSFDNSFNKPISKPDSTEPGSNQWNPSNADVSFDGSIKPNKPSAGPGSAWNPSNADISFDNAKSS